MRPPAIRLLVLAALTVVPLSACGGDDGAGGATPPPAGGGLVVRALDSLEFGEDRYRAAAGTIDISLENVGSLPHTFLVEGHEGGLELSVNGSGDADSGSIELPAGTYTAYCDVAGHRAAGMETTLIVE